MADEESLDTTAFRDRLKKTAKERQRPQIVNGIFDKKTLEAGFMRRLNDPKWAAKHPGPPTFGMIPISWSLAVMPIRSQVLSYALAFVDKAAGNVNVETVLVHRQQQEAFTALSGKMPGKVDLHDGADPSEIILEIRDLKTKILAGMSVIAAE